MTGWEVKSAKLSKNRCHCDRKGGKIVNAVKKQVSLRQDGRQNRQSCQKAGAIGTELLFSLNISNFQNYN